MAYQIEKNVPLAPKATGHANRKYPFGEMEVGDSFVADGTQARVNTAAKAFARYYGGSMKFATRKIEDGVRVWRVS